jgi:hypothetical protein
MDVYKKRRIIMVYLSLIIFAVVIFTNTPNQTQSNSSSSTQNTTSNTAAGSAMQALATLVIKGRAPKTDYSREQFGKDWSVTGGCDTRNIILNRDLANVSIDKSCNVTSGSLNDPYTGKIIQFIRGSSTSGLVQIDHVVALSDAWQKGAQQFAYGQRVALANDPLELLAVDGQANMDKSDGDAATWLPPNKPFRCQYIARQIAVKQKYKLWLTQAEHDAMADILDKCSDQLLPNP